MPGPRSAAPLTRAAACPHTHTPYPPTPAAGLKDERELSVAARLGCGALAGTTGQTVAYPFDVARRRLQMSGWQGAKALHADHGNVVVYRGMVDCFVRTVREEGMQALFKVRRARGLGPGVCAPARSPARPPAPASRRCCAASCPPCCWRCCPHPRPGPWPPAAQGLWPNYLKVVPSIAIAFVTYEQVKELLGVEFRISE